MGKKVIVSASNSKFFISLKTLISSIFRFNLNIIDEIHIYNLGLSRNELKELKTIKKIKIFKLPDDLVNNYPHFKNPENFAWKTYVIFNENKLGNNFFYIDAGAAFVNDFKIIFEIIEKEHIFLVGDYHKNHTWCHKKSLEIINASENEKNGNQICAGMQGYSANGKFRHIADEAFELAKIRDCIEGDVSIHRHDQCIYSILTQRANCPRQDLYKFGEWRGILNENQVIFVHRGLFKRLVQKNAYKNLIYYIIYDGKVNIEQKIRKIWKNIQSK